MKKLLLAAMMLIAIPSITILDVQTTYARSGGGVKVPASEVPKAVKKTLKTNFPSAQQVEWETNPVYYGTPIYKASFKLNGQKWEASITVDGTLVSAAPKA